MSTTSQPRFKFAVNTSGKDKNWDFKLLTTRYKDKEGTLEDVQRHVSAGHALCAGLLGGKSRSKANIVGSHWILLDIDNSAPQLDESGNPIKDENGKAKTVYTGELTLDAALAHPFIQKYCALIYTTASHKTDWHKFRLIFLLPEYLEGGDTVEVCIRFLMQHLPHDPACKDAGRVFYGNSKAEFPLVQPDAVLPMEWVEEARAIAQQERIIHAERVKLFEARKAEIRERNDAEGWNNDQLIKQALSFIPPRNPGSNTYEESLRVLMALVDYYGPAEAEIAAEQWSPSVRGTDWNISRKIRSFKRGGTSIGTLFHIAKQYGFKFPAPTQNHTSSDYYNKRDAEQEQFDKHCDRHTEQQKEESLKSSFNNRLERLRKFLSRTRSFKGFGALPESKPKTKPVDKQVDAGIIEFEEGDRQKTIEQLAQQAKETGNKLIVLDTSEGGSGKSHVVGDFTTEKLGVDTILYTSSKRTPTTAGIEANYTPMPVRNDGLVADENKKTPLGNPSIRWPRRGETPNLEGNCSKTHLFHEWAAKGYFAETSTSAEVNPICNSCKWKSNCAGVEGLPTIPKHTFRQERRDALASDRIRCSLDSLPDITALQGQAEGNARRVAIIADETTQFKFHDPIEADLRDFDATWMYLQSQVHKSWSLIADLTAQEEKLGEQVNQKQETIALLESEVEALKRQSVQQTFFGDSDSNRAEIEELEEQIIEMMCEVDDLDEKRQGLADQITEAQQWITGLPEALATLDPIIFSLREVLNGEEDITSETRFGWTEAMIRVKLGNLLNDQSREALEIIRKFSPRLKDLLKEADSVNLKGMSAKDRKGSVNSLKFARKAMQQETDEENREAITNMPSNCIIPVLDILLNQQDGSFRIAYGSLTIYTKNNRHRDQLKQADFTLILDGTETRESLAKKLECGPNEIVVIRQQSKSYKNLKIIQITGMGLLGADRSKTANSRVMALTHGLKDLHGAENIGIIDHKKSLDSEEESEAGYWHHSNRGSNQFQNKTALLMFGTPTPNIGHLQMLYAATTGDRYPARGNPAFDAFVKEQVQKEVVQGCWRLRSTRRPDERLSQYIVSDEDLSYLKDWFPDAEYEVKAAAEISMEAASVGEKTNLSIVEAAKILVEGCQTLAEAKKKLTQEAIANIVGCVPNYISKLSKKLFGPKRFESFKKMLLTLLESLYRFGNNFVESLNEDEEFAVKTFLPLVLEENVENPAAGFAEVISVASTLGMASFKRIVNALNPSHRGKLLGYVLTLLPEDWQQQFLEIATE